MTVLRERERCGSVEVRRPPVIPCHPMLRGTAVERLVRDPLKRISRMLVQDTLHRAVAPIHVSAWIKL